MSLVFQNVAAGNSPSGKTAALGGKQAAGTGAVAGVFNQSLAQMMLGDASQPSAAIVNAGTLLEGLLQLAGMGATGEEAGGDEQGVLDLLQSLTADMDKLDEAVAADPELLAALQGWLQQVQNLLNQANSAGNAAQAENADALTGPLSESPETIRFVVQDGMEQLASLLQKRQGAPGKTQHQALQLLQSFQELINNGQAAPSKPLETQTFAAQSKNAVFEPRISVLSKGVQPAGTEQTAAGDRHEQPDDPFATQHTVTVYQLALRHGINASAKAAAPAFGREIFGRDERICRQKSGIREAARNFGGKNHALSGAPGPSGRQADDAKRPADRAIFDRACGHKGPAGTTDEPASFDAANARRAG